jgi:hypothetical protein
MPRLTPQELKKQQFDQLNAEFLQMQADPNAPPWGTRYIVRKLEYLRFDMVVTNAMKMQDLQDELADAIAWNQPDTTFVDGLKEQIKELQAEIDKAAGIVPPPA